MIFVSLIENACSRRLPPSWRWLVLALVLVVAGLWSWHCRQAVAVYRALTIEEREAVISLFEPIDLRLPQVHGWTESFYRDFTAGGFSAAIDPSLPGDRLISLDGKHVSFSPAFFNADPLTQEGWLVQVMAQGNPTIETVRQQAELAARHDDDHAFSKDTE